MLAFARILKACKPHWLLESLWMYQEVLPKMWKKSMSKRDGFNELLLQIYNFFANYKKAGKHIVLSYSSPELWNNTSTILPNIDERLLAFAWGPRIERLWQSQDIFYRGYYPRFMNYPINSSYYAFPNHFRITLLNLKSLSSRSSQCS